MGLRLRLRALIFPCILTAALALGALTLTFFLRGGEVPAGLVNWRVLGGLAARFGIQYSVQSLRIGSFLENCRSPLDASGVQLAFRDFGPVSVRFDSLHWCRTEPLAIHGLKSGGPSQTDLVSVEDAEVRLDAGSASIRTLSLNAGNVNPAPQLTVGGLDFSTITGNAVARDIRISTGSESSANIQRVSMSPLVLSQDTGLLKVDSIDAAGVDVRLRESLPSSSAPSQTPSICERTGSLLSSVADIAPMAQRSVEALNQIRFRLNRDLFYLALVLPAVLFLVKVWTMGWTHHRGVRVLLGALSVLTPTVLYWMAGGAPLPRLVFMSFGFSFLLAMILRLRFYRHAQRWYQRWEPFTVDVVCFAIVLPLAAASFDFGAPLRLPRALEIGRATAADISLSGSQSECGARQVVSVMAKGAAIEQLHMDDSRFQIAKVDLPGLSAGIRDERTPDLDRVTVSDASASAEAIGVQVDWRSRQIRDLDAHFRLRGIVKAAGAAQELRKVRFLRPVAEGLKGIDFVVDLTASGARNELPITEDLRAFEDPGATVAFRGAMAFDPERCDLEYAWAARLLTGPMQLVSTGLGDSTAIDIRSIRTLTGSAFEIADGAGRISMSNDVPSSLRILGLRTRAGASQIQIDATDLSGAATSTCSQIHQSLSAGITGAHIEGAGGWSAGIERTEVEFKRAAAPGANPVSLIATIRDTGFMGRSSPDTPPTSTTAAPDVPPQISGNLPLLRLVLNGTTSGSTPGSTPPERIPRRFEGGLALALSTATDVLFRNDTPLNFLADLWEGAVTVPYQQQVVFQSVIPQLQSDVPLLMSLDGGLPTGGVAARVDIPRLSMDLGPFQTEIHDLRIDADTRAAMLAYDSGWNRVGLPKLPNIFCLEDIAQFDLSTEGEVKGLLLPEKLASESQNPRGRCVEAAPLPTERSFRIEGAWPSIRLEGASGSGIQIRDISNNQLRKADLRDARLQALELESKLSGIRTLAGAGALGMNAHVSISDGAVRGTTTLLGADDAPLADMALDGLPSRPDIVVVPRAGTAELIAALTPFLSGTGPGLGGIVPRARIDRLHANVQFEGPALAGLNAELDVGPGPLATIDTSAGTLDLSSIEDPASSSGTSLRLNWSKDAAEVHADLSRLSMQTVDARGARIQATASLHTTIHGTLSERRPPMDPILPLLSSAVGGLRRHFDKAVEVFGNPAARISQPADFSWKLRIHNPPAGESLLQFAPETVRIRLPGNLEKFAWRIGQSEFSSVAASGTFAGDLAIHDGQLVLDARVPATLEARLGTMPARKVELDLPLLVVFSDALEPARNASLWNSEYYERFWNNYRATQANRGAAPVVDTARFVAGPMSLRQIMFPGEPLRIAVGHADRFELHVPFSGRTLFGSAVGLFQTALEWREEQASFDGRFNLGLRNIQAGAVGLDSDYGHTPFVEDELDGDVMVRADNWRVDRNTFDRTLGLLSPGGLDALSLSLELRKSERSQSVPGMLQLSTDTQVITLNRILDRILRDLRLAEPPQKMSYRNLKFDFRMDKGRVATEAPWLTIDGLRLFSSTNLALEGNIRLHGTRYGETLELRNLLDAFIPK